MVKIKSEIDDEWFFTAYPIVKYKPEYYNEQGYYTRDEWGAMSDVGRVYDGHTVTLEEYLETEQRYVDAVIELMKMTGSQYLTVFFQGDTPYKKWNMKRMKSKKNRFLAYDEPLYETYVNLHQGQRIHIDKIEKVVRLNLREYAYTVLGNHKNELEFHFENDYYMYCNTKLNKNIVRKK